MNGAAAEQVLEVVERPAAGAWRPGSARRPGRRTRRRARRSRAPRRSPRERPRAAQRGERDEVRAVGEVRLAPRAPPRRRAASCPRRRARSASAAARSPTRSRSRSRARRRRGRSSGSAPAAGRVGRVRKRAQRREVRGQLADDELEELLGAVEVLEPVLAEVPERDAVRQIVARPAHAWRSRAAPGRRGRPPDPRGAVHVQADVVVAADAASPCAAHAHPDVEPSGQRCAASARCALTAAAIASRRVAKATKNASPSVSTSRPPCSANAAAGAADARRATRRTARQRVEQPCRALDVGEQEGDRAARKRAAGDVVRRLVVLLHAWSASTPSGAARRSAVGSSCAGWAPRARPVQSCGPGRVGTPAVGRSPRDPAMNEQRTSGTATVMFTMSSRRRTSRRGSGTMRPPSLLATHNTARPRPRSRPTAATDVRSTGDGFLVVFDSARAAPWRAPWRSSASSSKREHPIRVRIGLNAGELLQGGDELFGAAINLAARVMDRADGGEILTDRHRPPARRHDDGGELPRPRARRAEGVRRAPAALRGAAGRDPRVEELPPPRSRRRSRRAWVLGGAVVLVAAAGRDGCDRQRLRGRPMRSRWRPTRSRSSTRARDPSSATSAWTRTRDPSRPGPAGLWVLNQNSATLSRIDVRETPARRDQGHRWIPGGWRHPRQPRRWTAGRVGQRGRVQRQWVRRHPPRVQRARRRARSHGQRRRAGRRSRPRPPHVGSPKVAAAASPPPGRRSGRRRTARTAWCGSTTTQ